MDGNDSMLDTRIERRAHHVLRRQLDCLLECGGMLTERSPIKLAFEGCALIVRGGYLCSEQGVRDLIKAIADYHWPTTRHRSLAIEICLQQVQEAAGAARDGIGLDAIK